MARKIKEDEFVPKAFKKNKSSGRKLQDDFVAFVPQAFKKETATNSLKNQRINTNKKSRISDTNRRKPINRKKVKENAREELNNKKGKKTKGKQKKKHRILKFALIILLSITIVSGIKLGVSANKWKTLAKDMSKHTNSVVRDTENKDIASIGINKNKEYIPISEIPEDLKNAYVAIEDERFYSHIGIDIKRTGAAIISYITHFGHSSYGGSTITQQLVKNITGDSTESMGRKITEWWKAWQLETCMSKEEILEDYLNIIYVGPNVYGVKSGAKYYFNKDVSKLNLVECAFLAGINNSPNTYNPFSDKDNNEKILNRTKIVLDKMKELKYIDENNYNNAVAQLSSGLNFKNGLNKKEEEDIYSYHTDALLAEVTADIKDKYDISETFATNYLEMSGLIIHSTQDSKIQTQAEKEFEKSKYNVISSNKNNSQAAMVIIDHSTGYVLGCVGGLGEKEKSRCYNRATQSIRQTGSSIKPLSVLAPAIDKGIITASTIVDDTEKDFKNGYHPTDYSKALGKVTVRRAVESSQNIPFVEIMEKITPTTSMQYLQKMGITTLTDKDNSLPLALGGLEKGISPLQMAGAYAMIANDGTYIEPTFYSSVEKNGGEIIKSSQKKEKVIGEDVAYVIKNILKQPVLGTYGTATYCNISGVDVAAKTGTTDENYDRWLCGFTLYYTAVTWFGYDQNESINYNNKNPAGLIWANVMSRIHAGKQSKKFTVPASVTEYKVCSKTGKRAKSNCPDTYTEYYTKVKKPEGACDEHTGSELNKEPSIFDTDNAGKNTNNDNNILEKTQNKIQEFVQDITNDIDALDPQQINR